MNKDCEMIQDLLPLYVDQVCSEESKKTVEEHVSGCKECAKILEQMQDSIELPMDTDISDVKGLKKYINKKITKRTFVFVVLFVIIYVAANWVVTTRWAEIWPKVDEEGINEYLEIVEIDGGLYLHQQDLFGFGEIVDISSMEECESGVIRFYLGEQGLTSLSPTGMQRMWLMRDKYAMLVANDMERPSKIVYCHKDGTEVATLWQENETVQEMQVEK